MRLLVSRCMVAIARARIVWSGLAAAMLLTSAPAIAQQHVHTAGLPHDVPDFAMNPTSRAVKSGEWSAADTWSAGRIPGARDVVRIPAGISVTYDVVSDAIIASVGIEGSLTFRTDVNTRLVAGVVEVLPTGSLEIGRADAPVAPGVVAEMVIADVPLDPRTDPNQYGTSLIGLGKITMHGAIVEPTFARLAAEPTAGQKTLRLETPAASGWQSARLILPGTNPFRDGEAYKPQWEELVASSIDGAEIGLRSPLAFGHPGARDADGAPRFLPHAGNLTRNVIVRSANPQGTRGHVLFVHRADVDIRYSLFKDLGRTTIQPLDPRTNHIGRYSLHLHHTYGPPKPQPNGYQFTLIGNAIDGGSKWGITIHDSHYGLIRDNVVYNTGGAGVMTEDGSETGNVFDHNFVVRSWGTGTERADERRETKDWGYEGSAFWFRGPRNYVRNNVGANANSFAVTYMMVDVDAVDVPSKQGMEPGKGVNMMAMPILEFANNEVYASRAGLTVWNLGANCCLEVYEVSESVFSKTALWHLGTKGYYSYGSNRVVFDGWTQRGDRSALANGTETAWGIFFGDYLVRNTVIRNADIQGLRVGIVLPSKVGDRRDIYGSQPGTLLIEGGVLKNLVNVQASTMYGVTGGGKMLPPRITTIRNVQFGRVTGDGASGEQMDVEMAYRPSGANTNVVVPDEVIIYDFNNKPGDNFRVYYKEQAPTFTIPESNPELVGAPAPGLTNLEAWARYRLAIAGSVAPCDTSRSGFDGFTCRIK